MRDFINIVTDENLLLESGNPTYDNMLAPLYAVINSISDGEYQPARLSKAAKEVWLDTEKTLKRAKVIFRKMDRLVWFTRILRMSAACELNRIALGDHSDTFKDISERFTMDCKRAMPGWATSEDDRKPFSLITIQNQGVTGQLGFPQWLLNFKHYYELAIPAIDRLSFEGKSPSQIIKEMKAIEEEWKKSRAGIFPHSPEKELIVFPDGWRWVMLPQKFCDNEADAMGHCGNRYGNEGDSIISLRRIVAKGKEKFWRPSLTFILNRNGMLGEMKGRGNEKPVERYHPYIVALLKLPIIKGILGGNHGHAPENNFKIIDLSKEQKDDLFTVRPDFMDALAFYEKFGMCDKFKEMSARDIEHMDEIGSRHVKWVGDDLQIRHYRSATDLIETLGDKETENYAKYYNGDAYLENDFYDNSKGTITNFMDDLPRGSTDLMKQKIKRDFPEEVATWEEENDEDFLDCRDGDFYDFVNDELSDPEDIISDMARADSYGNESGANSEFYTAMTRAIKNPEDGFANIERIDGTDEYRAYLTVPQVVEVLTEPEEFIDRYYDNEKELLGEIKLNVPRYGFSGYDKEAAVDNYFEMHPEFEPAEKEKVENSID